MVNPHAKSSSETARALALELTGVFSAGSEDGQRGILGETTPSRHGLREVVLSSCIEEGVNRIQMKFTDMKVRGGVETRQVQEITCGLNISRKSTFA